MEILAILNKSSDMSYADSGNSSYEASRGPQFTATISCITHSICNTRVYVFMYIYIYIYIYISGRGFTLKCWTEDWAL